MEKIKSDLKYDLALFLKSKRHSVKTGLLFQSKFFKNEKNPVPGLRSWPLRPPDQRFRSNPDLARRSWHLGRNAKTA